MCCAARASGEYIKKRKAGRLVAFRIIRVSPYNKLELSAEQTYASARTIPLATYRNKKPHLKYV